jgi:sirohydrochlorin cobaltochelatase
MTHGLILFAHGARDPRWAQPFEAVAAAVRRSRPDTPVLLAFLEFMAPTLPAAGTALVQQGCRHITVLPMFLGAGGHVRKDLPQLLDEMRQAHPGLTLELSEAIGEIPSVVDAMAAAALHRFQSHEAPAR